MKNCPECETVELETREGLPVCPACDWTDWTEDGEAFAIGEERAETMAVLARTWDGKTGVAWVAE